MADLTLLSTLTPAQEAAIDALVDGVTHQTAARRAGVTEAELYQWRTYDRGFGARLDSARASRWAHAASDLRAGVQVAVEALVAIAGDQEARHGDRVRAAVAILDRAGLPGAQVIQREDTLDLEGLTDDELDTVHRLLLRGTVAR